MTNVIAPTDSVYLTTPVGRMVDGSLYDPQTTDWMGNLRVYKTGPKTGEPKPDYYVAFAIPKKGETHWNQTAWGRKIWDAGLAFFPGGHSQRATFAWKITDGDSTEPNSKDVRPCDKIGFPGNWVLHLSRTPVPKIVNRDGSEAILTPDFINLGDYIQVLLEVRSNNSPTQNPGVFLNHQAVSFQAYGERIVRNFGPSPEDAGFGQDALPEGASVTPPAAYNSVKSAPSVVPPAAVVAVQPHSAVLTPDSVKSSPSVVSPAAVVAVQPHSAILTPPTAVVAPPASATRQMTAKAKGSYEEYIKIGWTDELLIRDGYMTA